MEKAKLRLVLRAALIALFALIVLLVGLSFVSDKLLPDELAEWQHRASSGDFSLADAFGLIFWLGGLTLTFVSMAGLFFYQRWAAWMLLVVMMVFSLQVIFSPTVEPGLLSYLGGWSDVLSGLILGIAFFTDALASGE